MGNGDQDLQPYPTDPAPRSLDRLRRARTGRRGILALLIAFLVLGGANLLGVRTGTVSATGGGYTLTVAYGSVTRPGLGTIWAAEVRRAGGFDGMVALATTRSYLDLFDHHVLHPEPAESTGTEDRVIWLFDPPPGDVFAVTMDARLEPAEQASKTGETAVLVAGKEAVSVRYTTKVVP